MKKVLTIAALLLTNMALWAGEVTTTVLPSANAGTVVASVENGTCRLTVTPNAGYWLTVDYLTAVKITDGGNAQAPRRGVELDGEKIEIAPEGENADPSGVTTYTFVMPEDNNLGVEVTAEFQSTFSIADAKVTFTPSSFVYDGNPKVPTVEVSLGNTVLTDDDYEVDYDDNINAHTVTATISGKRTYSGETQATFVIEKASPSLILAKENMKLDLNGEKEENNDLSVFLGGNSIQKDNMMFRWESSNERVATVSQDGTVTARGVGVAIITVTGPVDNDNFNPGQTSCEVTVFATYGLTIGETPVTSDNRTDIFGDGKAKYDGTSLLMLDNMELNGSIVTSESELTIYLTGTNIIKSTGVAIVNSKGNGRLTFTTQGNKPGTMTLKNALGEGVVVSGFSQIGYEQNLTLLSGAYDKTEAAIGTPIEPLVDENGEKKDVPINNSAVGQTDLSNTTVGDVLYTLEQQNGDALGDDCVVLSTTMNGENVDKVVSENKPGTNEFAQEFAGLTFMVPAGTGTISVVAKTGPHGVLNVKIGNDEPYVITGALDFTEYSFPYACPEATYVYIYNSSVPDTSAPGHRASKKTSITVGVRTIGVQASHTQESNNAAAVTIASDEVEVVTSNDVTVQVDGDTNSVLLNSPNIIDLPNDVFQNLVAFVNAIDLRGTSINGLVVSRSNGIFNGISENTFIFMPTGNSTEDNNVVVGMICPRAVLDANMPEGESFAPVDGFVAQRVTLDRIFAKDEMATVYLPFPIDAASAAKFGSFYTFDRSENGFVKINEVTTGLEANKPYLFKASEDGMQIVMKAVQVSLPEESPAPSMAPATADGMYGCYKHVQGGSDDLYRFVPGEQLTDGTFVRMKADEKILPFQAYLRVNGAGESLKVTDNESVITGIHNIEQERCEGVQTYDLSGREVDGKSLTKGVYIRNGRKVVVK